MQRFCERIVTQDIALRHPLPSWSCNKSDFGNGGLTLVPQRARRFFNDLTQMSFPARPTIIGPREICEVLREESMADPPRFPIRRRSFLRNQSSGELTSRNKPDHLGIRALPKTK